MYVTHQWLSSTLGDRLGLSCDCTYTGRHDSWRRCLGASTLACLSATPSHRLARRRPDHTAVTVTTSHMEPTRRRGLALVVAADGYTLAYLACLCAGAPKWDPAHPRRQAHQRVEAAGEEDHRKGACAFIRSSCHLEWLLQSQSPCAMFAPVHSRTAAHSRLAMRGMVYTCASHASYLRHFDGLQ